MTSSSSSKLAHAAVRGTTWVYIALFSGKFIVFLTTIFLARILSKSDFGVVGYAVTVIGFLDVVKDLGIGSALIYHHEDRTIVSTAFWLNVSASIFFLTIMWFGAPVVGIFFNDSRAVWVTRVLAFSFPLDALGSIQETLLIKDLAFSQKFIPDFARAISKGTLSIILALAGFGPWSIILGQLGGFVVSTIILWQIIPWRPTLNLSWEKALSLLRYGVPLASMDIVSVFVLNVDYLLIGRYLGAEALGIYTLAFRIPELTILQLCNIVAQVVFPVFSKIRDDVEALRKGFLKTTQYVALITVPLGLGMTLLSKSFILALFGQKWADAIPVMQAISIYTLILSLGYNAGDVYKAQGQPGVLMKLSIVQACMLVPSLLWAIKVGGSVVYVAWVQVVVAFIGNIIYLIVALRMLNLSLKRLAESLMPPFLPALGMSMAVFAVITFGSQMNSWFQLLFGVLVGAVVYVGFLWLFSKTLAEELFGVAKAAILQRGA